MWDYGMERRGLIAHEAWQHVSLVVQCVLLGSAIAVILAMLVYRSPAATALANATSAIGLTIPSFALLGLLLAPFGFAPVLQTGTLRKYPQLRTLFGKISPLLTDETMQRLNAEVDVDGEQPGDVALDWMVSQGLVRRS